MKAKKDRLPLGEEEVAPMPVISPFIGGELTTKKKERRKEGGDTRRLQVKEQIDDPSSTSAEFIDNRSLKRAQSLRKGCHGSGMGEVYGTGWMMRHTCHAYIE